MFRHLIRRNLVSSATSATQQQNPAAAETNTTTAPPPGTSRIVQLTAADVGRTVRIAGWVQSRRTMKNTVFVDVNDGTGPQHLQVITGKTPVSTDTTPSKRPSLGYGASVRAVGRLGLAPSGQLELKADQIDVLGECPFGKADGFPFVPRQQHSAEYVRQHLHLRARDPTSASRFRLRSHATRAFASHLDERGFWQVHTPACTTNDCEGGGEVFSVRPASDQLLRSMQRSGDLRPLEQAYFDRTVCLSVSGQLHLEAMCHGLGSVYSLGPIFRAENSRTALHLAEFYMLEVEQAFVGNVADVCATVEELLKTVTVAVLERGAADLEVVQRTARHSPDFGWLQRPFAVLTFSEAVRVLHDHGTTATASADGLSKEQELQLVEHCGGPVFVVEWPAHMKPFYTRASDVNGDFVQAVDLLVPHVGELCGGSVREDDAKRLSAKLPAGADLQWYLDLRKFGGVRTGGFGIGLERYLQWIMGMPNIRDVIPFPRWAHNCSM